MPVETAEQTARREARVARFLTAVMLAGTGLVCVAGWLTWLVLLLPVLAPCGDGSCRLLLPLSVDFGMRLVGLGPILALIAGVLLTDAAGVRRGRPDAFPAGCAFAFALASVLLGGALVVWQVTLVVY